MSDRRDFALISACVISVLAFAGYQLFSAPSIRTYPPNATFTERGRLTEFSTNGVGVALYVESDFQGQAVLRATFTPTESGFHLYSADLDPKSVGGVGLPTILELLRHSLVKSVGPAFADVLPQNHVVKELGVSIPIYPDGPVTLRLPVKFFGTETDVAAQVAVSYIACNTDGVCLRPVDRQILNVKIPRWIN